jgi:hypothetical protein
MGAGLSGDRQRMVAGGVAAIVREAIHNVGGSDPIIEDGGVVPW